MKGPRMALLSVCFLVIFGAGSSYAQMCGCMDKMEEGMHMRGEMGHQEMEGMRGMRGGGHPMWKHLMGLGLDEKQKEAVKAIQNKEMKAMIQKRANRQIAKVELREILAKDPVDMKAVEAKLKQIEGIETDMRLAHIRTMEDVKELLTPDQKKKMREMIEMGPMSGGMGMMGGMGAMQGCGMTGGGMQRGGMEMCSSPEKRDGGQPPMEHTHH